MNVKTLLDELCKFVAEMIAQRTPNEILDYFNIKKDATWEEEQELIATHKWIDPEGLIAKDREKRLAEMQQQLAKLASELQLRQDEAAQDLELRLERHAAQLDEGSKAERESMAEHIALLERTIEAASNESRSRVDASKRQLEGDLRALHLRAVHAENLAAENLGAYSDAVGRIPLLERQIGLLEQQLKEDKAGADARAADLESTLQQAQSDLKSTILREIGAVKEAQQTATERQDAKIATVEAEVLQRLTHGITTLRADTEAKLTSQNKKVTKELANAKSDAEDRHERISRQLATLEEDLTRRVSKELAEVRSAVAALESVAPSLQRAAAELAAGGGTHPSRLGGDL